MDFSIYARGRMRRRLFGSPWNCGRPLFNLLQDEDSRLDKSITEAMNTGLECLYTIAVMSPEYFQSKYTTQEWQGSHYAGTLIQVMFRKSDRPRLIAPLPNLEFKGKTDEDKRKLLRDGVRPLVRPTGPCAPYRFFLEHNNLGPPRSMCG